MDDLERGIADVRTGDGSEKKPEELSAGRLLPDHFYGPPTLEKLEKRLFDLAQRVDVGSSGVAGLDHEVERLRSQVHRLIAQLDNVQEETGIRADRIAIRAVSYMEKMDAMEARKAKRWERLGNAALWAFVTAIFLFWMLRQG